MHELPIACLRMSPEKHSVMPFHHFLCTAWTLWQVTYLWRQKIMLLFGCIGSCFGVRTYSLLQGYEILSKFGWKTPQMHVAFIATCHETCWPGPMTAFRKLCPDSMIQLFPIISFCHVVHYCSMIIQARNWPCACV